MKNDWVIYEWLSWGKFLLFDLLPEALQIKAHADDDVSGILGKVPSDCEGFAFHLNLTLTHRFPNGRADLVAALQQRGLQMVNAEVDDISKRKIQQVCQQVGTGEVLADEEGDADELVIVKTNFNSGSTSERQMKPEHRELVDMGKIPELIQVPDDYLVVPRAEVDPSWWDDPGLICEKFITNRQHLWYRCFFFFSRLVLCEFANRDLIKKVGPSTLRNVLMLDLGEQASDLSSDFISPSEVAKLVAFRDAFRLDFGAIDLVRNDQGELFVIDVNTTPTYLNPVPGLVEFLSPARSLTGQE